jgi:hypothetical protein
MDIYEVEYETSWSNSELFEEDSKRVAAIDAKAAIEKVESMVWAETFKDEEGNTVQRDTFKLTGVHFVTDFEE